MENFNEWQEHLQKLREEFNKLEFLKEEKKEVPKSNLGFFKVTKYEESMSSEYLQQKIN